MTGECAPLPQSPGRRAAAYWFSDGLPEIAWGLSLAVVGAAAAARVVYRADWWSQWLLAAAAISYLSVVIGERRILGFFKGRLTYRRTGYVEPPVDGYPEGEFPLTLNRVNAAKRRDNVTSFRVGTVQLLIFAPMILEVFGGRSGLILMMFAAAGLVFWGARRSEHPYSLWSVLPLGLLGIPLSALDLPIRGRESLAILAGGLWLCLQGIWNLRRYLHENPHVPAADAQTG